jgi:hypothetical protein
VLQRRIVLDALEALETIQAPGTVRMLPHRWVDDTAETLAWKAAAMRAPPSDPNDTTTRDTRVARHGTPQYQTVEDEQAARDAFASHGCPTCVFPVDPAR